MTDSSQSFALTVTLDRESPIPLHEQISTPLEQLILSGELTPGQLIEDEVSMAKRLNVSRPTTRRALQDLVSRGLLTRRRGVGTHVTPTHLRRPQSLSSLQDDLTQAGLTPTTTVVNYEVRLANNEDASLLHIPEGSEIVSVTRVRMINNQPLAILRNLIPAHLAPSITQLNTESLYTAFTNAGLRPAAAQQAISARMSAEDEAAQLALTHPSPVLTMERTAMDDNGQVLEFGRHVYNPKNYAFHSTLISH